MVDSASRRAIDEYMVCVSNQYLTSQVRSLALHQKMQSAYTYCRSKIITVLINFVELY